MDADQGFPDSDLLSFSHHQEVNEMESAKEIGIFCDSFIEDNKKDAMEQLAGKASLRWIYHQTSD